MLLCRSSLLAYKRCRAAHATGVTIGTLCQVWRARHERDAATARARQLSAALAAHGLAPPPRRLASAAALLAGAHIDATRPRTLHALHAPDAARDLDRPLSCGDLRDRSLAHIPTLVAAAREPTPAY